VRPKLTKGRKYYKNENTQMPVRWTAIEALLKGKFSVQSDVWSFGVTIWELYSRGSEPYVGMSHVETFMFIQDGKRLPNPKNCPPEVFDMLTKCWMEEPSKRPSFDELTSFFDSRVQKTNTSSKSAHTPIGEASTNEGGYSLEDVNRTENFESAYKRYSKACEDRAERLLLASKFNVFLKLLQTNDIGADFKLDNMALVNDTFVITDGIHPSKEDPFIPMTYKHWVQVAQLEAKTTDISSYTSFDGRLQYWASQHNCKFCKF